MKYIIEQPHAIYELGQRANQEDNIYPKYGEATSDDSLFIVCDGMGGHESGEVASSTVCEEMSRYINSHADGYYFDEDDFQEALSATFDSLDAKDNGAEKKMGTTMTFMKFNYDGCFMAHIGDSRMYHVRPSTNEILFKSRDHSLVNDLVDIGELTEEEAKTSRQKNIITRAIQPLQERRARAAIKHITDIQTGDYFYICSDGMLEQMEDAEILSIMCMEGDDNKKINALIEATAENRDNHSAYLIKIKEAQDVEPAPRTKVEVAAIEITESESTTDPIIEVEVEPTENERKRKIITPLNVILFLLLIAAVSFFSYSTFVKKSDKKTQQDSTVVEKVENAKKTPKATTAKPKSETTTKQQPKVKKEKKDTVSRIIHDSTAVQQLTKEITLQEDADDKQ